MTVARAAFAANWQFSSRWLARDRRKRVGQELEGVGRPRFLSAVARLPAGIAERLADAASDLAGLQPGHYRCPPASIHLTVLGLADLPGIEDEVGAVIGRHGTFEIEVCGLNVTLVSVFAELHPVGSGLGALRRDLRALESTEHGPASRWLRRRLAHANVMRFAAPVDPRLIAEVGRLRCARFGRFELREVELVRTDKVLSATGTLTLARFALG